MGAIPRPDIIPDDYQSTIYYDYMDRWVKPTVYEDIEWENYVKHVNYQYDEEYLFIFLTPYFNESSSNKWAIVALEIGIIDLDVFLDNMVVIGYTDIPPNFVNKNSSAQKIKQDRISKRYQWNRRFYLQNQPTISQVKKYMMMAIDNQIHQAPEIIEKF